MKRVQLMSTLHIRTERSNEPLAGDVLDARFCNDENRTKSPRPVRHEALSPHPFTPFIREMTDELWRPADHRVGTRSRLSRWIHRERRPWRHEGATRTTKTDVR